MDRDKARKILSIVHLKSSLTDEDKVREEHLYQAIDEEISDELSYLGETDILEFQNIGDQNYVSLAEPPETDPIHYSYSELEVPETVTEEVDETGLPEIKMVLEDPEKYVAALKPFGDALENNPEVPFNEDFVRRYTGVDLDVQLQNLSEWGYLEQLTPEEIGVEFSSTFYKLNLEDKEVRADAAFASSHIDEYYDGNIQRFIDKNSEKDSRALRLNGVNFYKN